MGPDILVGLFMDRSLEMIIALLGILKAGGAYLPLDPANPQDRLVAILQEVGWPLVLADAASAERLSGLPCRVVPFSDERYVRELLDADIIISPKRLANGYEMGHTEYKIALGMAVGLPAIASPQPSYLEALADGGGIVARDASEWRDALARLAGDAALRAETGRRAQQTVIARYSIAAVAPQYARLFDQVLGVGSWHDRDALVASRRTTA